MHFKSVVLPVPLGPMIDTTSPRDTERLTPQEFGNSRTRAHIFQIKHSSVLVQRRLQTVDIRAMRSLRLKGLASPRIIVVRPQLGHDVAHVCIRWSTNFSNNLNFWNA